MEQFSLDTAPRYERHYNEDKLWQKLRKFARRWGEKLLYPAMILYCMLKSPEISLRDKALIAGALGYLILPIDAIPDFLPIAGLTDDIAAIFMVLKTLDKDLTPEIRQEARQQTDKLLKQ